MQYHFVALLKLEVPVENNTEPIQENAYKSLNQIDTSSDDIDDDEIQQDDQHTVSITGGPSASLLVCTCENPEAVLSIAPCEGNHPLTIHSDADFEHMCNPDKFCYGTGGYNSPCQRKITCRKYFNRLLDIDGRFAKDLDYLFIAQYIVESKQVFDDANN